MLQSCPVVPLTAERASQAAHPLDFFSHLKWLDGRPLLDTIEEYRRAIFTDVLYTFGPDGTPHYSLALCGRAKEELEVGRPLSGWAVPLPRQAVAAGQ